MFFFESFGTEPAPEIVEPPKPIVHKETLLD